MGFKQTQMIEFLHKAQEDPSLAVIHPKMMHDILWDQNVPHDAKMVAMSVIDQYEGNHPGYLIIRLVRRFIWENQKPITKAQLLPKLQKATEDQGPEDLDYIIDYMLAYGQIEEKDGGYIASDTYYTMQQLLYNRGQA